MVQIHIGTLAHLLEEQGYCTNPPDDRAAFLAQLTEKLSRLCNVNADGWVSAKA